MLSVLYKAVLRGKGPLVKHLHRVVSVAAGLAVMATLLAAAPSASEATEPEMKIAAMGDSISQAATTDGAPVNAPRNSWSTGNGIKVNSHLSHLRAEGIDAIAYNNSESGAYSLALLEQAEKTAAEEVDYVTLLSGANDLCFSPSVEGIQNPLIYQENIRVALQVLYESSSRPEVLVGSVPSLMSLYEAGKSSSAARAIWDLGICQVILDDPLNDSVEAKNRRNAVELKVQEYNAALEQVCSEFSNCTYDGGAIYNINFKQKDLSVDFFHPAISGQNKIAVETWNVADEKIFGGRTINLSPHHDEIPQAMVPPVVAVSSGETIVEPHSESVVDALMSVMTVIVSGSEFSAMSPSDFNPPDM